MSKKQFENQKKDTTQQASLFIRIKTFLLAKDVPQSKAEQTIRRMLSLFFFVMTAWIFLPVLSLNEGMLFGVCTGILFLLSAFPGLSRLVFQKNKVVSRIVTVAIIVIAIAVVGTLSILVYGGVQPAQSGSTVIVLGCQVRGEAPSLMLQRRINAALVYAQRNPDSKILATGGKGRGETISEAECTRRYLVAHGIDENRIYIEDRSLNTEQNLKYSAEIIAREGLNPTVVIASSRFHQYRASLFAHKYNLVSSPLACGTMWWMAPGYWGREVFAVWRAWILGY